MIKIQNETSGTVAYDDGAANTVRDSWVTAKTLSLANIKLAMYPAGHVAGAKMLGIFSEGKTILYTGDFCIHDTEILEGCNVNLLPREPEVLVSESTYGGKIRPAREELTNQFLGKVSGTMKRWGNILIPTFAFHRSQEMAKRIDQAIEDGVLPHYNAYVISKLGHKITAHFNANKHLFKKEISRQEKPFEYKHVKYIERTSDIEEPAIVVCTSGFGHAGASLSLLELWAEGEENTIILTSGFLPADSPLRFAKEKNWFRAAEGDKIMVNGEIATIELSGHADQLELIQLVTKLKPKKTVLVHGDLPQAKSLLEKLSGLTEVCIPEKNETIEV